MNFRTKAAIYLGSLKGGEMGQEGAKTAVIVGMTAALIFTAIAMVAKSWIAATINQLKLLTSRQWLIVIAVEIVFDVALVVFLQHITRS